LTNFFTIVGVLVATFQISSTRQIIEAIFTSQEKAASYRILAMKTEVQTNVNRIQNVMSKAQEYALLHQSFQVPLLISVYYSDPTFFKLEHLDKAKNDEINQKIAEIYASWQIVNSLIQASEGLTNSTSLNPRLAQANLLKNNLKILEIMKSTLQPAQEVLNALSAESSPS
jgi:hypothetical protein